MQDVGLVSSNDQLVDWQAHLLSEIARVDITKIARRHRERHGLLRPAKAQRRREIVDDLHKNARPVNRVHGDQLPVFGKKTLVGKRRLHDALAIVEIALDC